MANQEKFVGTHLPDHLHRVLISMATSNGLRPDEMASQLLVFALEQEAERREEDAPLPLDQRVFLFYQRSRRGPAMRMQLLAAAQQIVSTGDERFADEFGKLCLEAGFEAQDILRDAESLMNIAQGSSIVLDPSSSVDRAMMFLVDTYRAAGMNSLPGEMLLTKGAGAGLSSYAMKAAKARLGLRSVRKGSQWHWELQSIKADFSPVSVQS